MIDYRKRTFIDDGDSRVDDLEDYIILGGTLNLRIFALELDNDIKGIYERKQYIESLIAKLQNPELVVLPELALCSYMGSDAIWKYADEDSQMTSKWAMEMAEKYNTYIAVGFLEKSEGDYYNSYLIADKDKVYGTVRKSEGESYIFKRGDFNNIISTPFGEVGVGICYDSRRKHFYESIKDRKIALILFPHGSPNNPNDEKSERRTNDFICGAYEHAFNIPVVYVNSVGKMDFMLGKTGKMMMGAGFRLNGLSKIYANGGTSIKTNIKEAIGVDIDLIPKERKQDIKFYGNDINKGNSLFRYFILKPDIRAGIKFYEKMKDL
ncbi:MAG: carbon-nitrogen hydrolase family protein [Bacilli bacterium]|nr:carbon-nitrogen hydrolase family protein [Bacilli bacterium]